MLFAITNAARRLDLWLGKAFGRPYHALLGIGIVIELIQHVRELVEKPWEKAGIIKIALGILLLLALLVHQTGELSEHAEGQRRRDE
jgi:hypothetical protein